ncbi:hypothetical protein [Sphingomonas sp.]|uniref:hypothetical protein n=1 Tax=Sphingomonas sp. TaxID=28214 RepID=UPI001B1228F0|nr:hypothetical protein [Sphingomonas sp.]MBO9713895.1 hypothetical protein [Sphingomonas sp.]
MSGETELLDSDALKAAAAELLALLPATIRVRDAAEGHPLEALIRVFASGSLELSQALDAMADAAFVETADDAGLEDLGQLVGATPLVPLPAGAGHDLRAYVANTLRNRAGKGTARSLEQLATDVGSFGTLVVEYFQRLARTENLIDVRAERPGFAGLRPGITRGQAGTGFDTLPRLADFRSIARAAGRHHVPNVGVHLLRPVVPRFPAPPGATVAAEDIDGVPRAAAWTAQPGFFRLAAQPDGVVRLFNPDRRPDAPGARPVPQALPDRLARLPLHLETQELRRALAGGRSPVLAAMPWFTADAPFTIFTSIDGLSFRRVPPAEIRIANLAAPPSGRPFDTADGAPVAVVIDPVTGRLALPAPPLGKPEASEVRVAYGTGIALPIGAGPQERNDDSVPFELVDEPGLAHFVRIVDATVAAVAADAMPLRRVPTLAAALIDWAEARKAAKWKQRAYQRVLFVLDRCDRETAAGTFALPLAAGVEHHLVAGQWRDYTPRPGAPPDPGRLGFIVRLERRSILQQKLAISAAPTVLPEQVAGSGTLVIDGVEFVAGLAVAEDCAQSIRVRHCTVRAPGNIAIQVIGAWDGGSLSFEQAVLGQMKLSAIGATGTLAIRDCIVAPDGAAGAAIEADALDTRLDNVTLLGTSSFKSLEATNILFTDVVTVKRTQAGCVRYSYVHKCYDAAGGSRVPRRFRCLPDLARAAAVAKKGAELTASEAAEVDLSVRPFFLDTGVEEPTCAMLHPLASEMLRLGGEGEAEIGAFARAAEGLRMANVRRLFDEALPFGLEAGLIDDTRSSAAAARRNVP